MLVPKHFAECHGVRVQIQRAPRGTPARIISLRLRRCFHHHPRISLALTPRNGTTNTFVRRATTHVAGSSLSNSAIHLLQDMLEKDSASHPMARSHENPPFHPIPSDVAPAASAAPTAEDRPKPMSFHVYHHIPYALHRALNAVRKNDPSMLIRSLNDISKLNEQAFEEAVKAIPRNTFLEMFRLLDPLHFAANRDVFGQTFVPVGMYKMLNPNGAMDDYGVRRIYTQLLRVLLSLMAALTNTGHTLHMEEYITLFRCAGAATDLGGVTAIWKHLCSNEETIFWLNPEVYYEYLCARFLVHPLYTGYNKERRGTTPWTMSPFPTHLRGASHFHWHHLRRNIRHKKLHFGLNKDVEYVEDVMSQLRTRLPVDKIFRTTVPRLHVSENYLCAFIVAYGRCAHLEVIGPEILEKFFGIQIGPANFGPDEALFNDPQGGQVEQPLSGSTGHSDGESKTAPQDDLENSQSEDHLFESLFTKSQGPSKVNFTNQLDTAPALYSVQPGPIYVRPTATLMRAIVEAFGSNAEIATAVKLVEFISGRYRVRIPSDVWLDILEWTHIHSVPPASTAWRRTGYSRKVPGDQATILLWRYMTSRPYNEVPTFRHYRILIRNLVGYSPLTKDGLVMERIVQFMRSAIPFYRKQCADFEKAALDYAGRLRDGTDQTEAGSKYQVARAGKETMWYEIADWCRQLLRKIRVSRDNPVPDSSVHDFIEEFREFMFSPVEYPTPTGYVELLDPSSDVFESEDLGFISKDFRYTDQGQEQWTSIVQRKVVVHSSHSLANMKTSRADARFLLQPARFRERLKHGGGRMRRVNKSSSSLSQPEFDGSRQGEGPVPEERA